MSTAHKLEATNIRRRTKVFLLIQVGKGIVYFKKVFKTGAKSTVAPERRLTRSHTVAPDHYHSLTKE